jgi:uncharacterized protein YdeI (YjbR/CyaY-like superfamily)
MTPHGSAVPRKNVRMPTNPKQDLPVLEISDQCAWEEWLAANHESSGGVWLKIAKKGAARSTVTYTEAIEAALCCGWIDGQKGAYDESFWLQRFTARKARSKWSLINREKATALIAAGRMKPAGLAEVQRAQQDGRWEAAYEPQGRATVPEDFQRELNRNPEAKALFLTLTGANRYAFLYRIADAKRPETRAKRVATFIAMLNDRKTFHP